MLSVEFTRILTDEFERRIGSFIAGGGDQNHPYVQRQLLDLEKLYQAPVTPEASFEASFEASENSEEEGDAKACL
jgi:hypothetical protein